MKVAPIHFAIEFLASSATILRLRVCDVSTTDIDSLCTMYIFKDKEIRYDGLEKIKD